MYGAAVRESEGKATVAVGMVMGSYLVTGGLTGLGLASASLLVQRGARQVILCGRRAADAGAAARLAGPWRAGGSGCCGEAGGRGGGGGG